MKRFGWSAMTGFGIAGLLVTAIPASADHHESRQTGSTTAGSSSAQEHTDPGTKGESGKKGTGARGSGMGGTSTGARPGEVTGAGTEPGASQATRAGVQEVTGKIEEFDRQGRILTIENSQQKLTLTDDTQVLKDGEPASIGDLMEGDEVRASFSAPASGDTVEVERVEVLGTAPTEGGGPKGSGMGGTSTGARPGEVGGTRPGESTGAPSGTSTGKSSGASTTEGGSPDTGSGTDRTR